MPLPQPEPPQSGERPLAAGETSRSIALGDRPISYVLRRSRRHTIGLSIDQHGLRIGAPQRASLREVESLIRQHGEWIGRKLDEWQHRRPPERLQIVDGVQLPLLGSPLSIRLALGANRTVWNLQAAERVLTLCLRSPTEAPRLLEKALRERARLLFSERIDHYLPQLGVARPPLSLSAARTRWGSCSLRSGIRLNWRLIHFAPPLIDYVVVHELAHLREMNHSEHFWSIVAALYPDYRSARAELKRCATNCPHW